MFAKKNIHFISLRFSNNSVKAYKKLASLIVYNWTNPGSNKLQFHRLVIMRKIIPLIFINMLVKKKYSFEKNAIK